MRVVAVICIRCSFGNAAFATRRRSAKTFGHSTVEEIEALGGLAIADLRKRWQDFEDRPPNRRWGRHVLIRGIAWRRQEEDCGKIPHGLKPRLDRLADRLKADPAYEPIRRPCSSPAPASFVTGTARPTRQPCWKTALLGGGGGIRTHGTRKRTTVFETAPFDHSGTPPLVRAATYTVESRAARLRIWYPESPTF